MSCSWSAVTCMRIFVPWSSWVPTCVARDQLFPLLRWNWKSFRWAFQHYLKCLRLLVWNSTTDAWYLSIRSEINSSGSGYGFPTKLISLDIPTILLMALQEAILEFALTNIYLRNIGLRSPIKRDTFLWLIFCISIINLGLLS